MTPKPEPKEVREQINAICKDRFGDTASPTTMQMFLDIITAAEQRGRRSVLEAILVQAETHDGSLDGFQYKAISVALMKAMLTQIDE
jgi:hypothetical protein